MNQQRLVGDTSADQNTVLQWAHFYAFTMGWVIQPIHKFMGLHPVSGAPVCSCELTGKRWDNCNANRPGKHPWRGWKKNAMETPEQGFALWKSIYDQYPTGINIGVRTGSVSGIWALDIDMGAAKNGVLDLQGWLEKNDLSFPDIETLGAQTGGGGFHYIYSYPNDVEKISTVAPHKEIGPSVDIKGDGGFILVPPSFHASGKMYEWVTTPSPDALRPAPEKLVRIVERKSRTVGSLDLDYTPSIEELKDHADQLVGKKSTRSKEIGRNMRSALQGAAIAEDGGAHDAYRDITYVIAKKWPTCSAAEIVSHFEDSIGERFAHKADASTDINNVLDAMHTALDKAKAEAKEWGGQVMMNDQGKPMGTVPNAMLFFQNHNAWKDVLGFNSRTRNYAYVTSPPSGGGKRAVDEDHDGASISLWFQTKSDMVIDPHKALDALHTVAHLSHFDPLQVALMRLQGTWDGVKRLDTALQRVGGTEDTAWVRKVFPLWMKSLVARILWPGCKVDTMLILEGKQGYKKSMLFELLLSSKEWFDGSLTKLKHDVATHRHIHSGPAIFEVGELVGLRKQEVEDIKSFLSTAEDTFDEKYKKTRAVPRRCVLVGSTNEDTYLRDESGGRRFWPVKINKVIDAKLVIEEREQWFAEALYMLSREGEIWWFESTEDEAMAAEEQDARFEEDIWNEPIFHWLYNGLLPSESANDGDAPSVPTTQMTENANKTRAGGHVTLAQVAEYALNIEMKNARGPEAKRIEKVLRRYGCTPTRIRKDGKRVRAWKVPPKTPED